MSTVREQFDATLEITVGTTKVMQLVIEDPETGEVVDMTDTDVFNTGNFVITKPDKTIIATISIVYVNRVGGIVEFPVDSTVTTLENAGNWIGTVQFINAISLIIDQRVINFNILA